MKFIDDVPIQFKLLFALFIILVIIFINALKNTNSDSELHFTREQKAVLKALKNAKDELRQVQSDIDNEKAQLHLIVADVKASEISKGISINVGTYWTRDTSSLVRGTSDKTPVLIGFREDRLLVWKFADEK